MDWPEVRTKEHIKNLCPTTKKRDLLEHQKKAFHDVLEGFEGYDRGRLIMACGTGEDVFVFTACGEYGGCWWDGCIFGTDDSVDIADYVGVVEVSRYRS